MVDVQLIVAIIMETLNLGSLDAVIHPFDMTIGPLAVVLCQPMLDPVGLANHIEAHRSGIDSITRALLRIYSSDQWYEQRKSSPI